MELVSDYMSDNTLRHALNELTRKTFFFDFEDWVTGGYFEGDYIPYSFIEDGKIISNVSANRMTFLQNGVERNYIQIGTVMTDETYRRQGLARKLIEHVVKQYKDSCDGFYLFANLDALDFYDKCGFARETEYRYKVKEDFCRGRSKGECFVPVNTADVQMKQKYMDMIRHSAANSSMEQINKFGLQMFYTADMENDYYAKDYTDENGNKVEYDETYYINGEEILLPQLTQEQVDRIVSFVESVNKRGYYNEAISNIISEEAGAYFSGQKSARDVAGVIQSRVQVYVNENR